MNLAELTLADGTPAVDHLGHDITVFVLGAPPVAVGEIVAEAMDIGRPVKVVRVPFADARERWGARVVITDALGKVCFRGDGAPDDAPSLLEEVSRPDRSR